MPGPYEIVAGTTAARNNGGANEGGANGGWPNATSNEAIEAGMSYDTIDAGGVAVIGGRDGTSKGREMAGASLPGGRG